LGWRDPFSSEAFSRRQRDYSQSLGARGLYTPQAVIDGRTECIGSDRAGVVARIRSVAATPKAIVSITIETVEEEPDHRNIAVKLSNLPPPPQGDAYVVLVAITEDQLSTAVAHGENAGRKLGHNGVVRRLIQLGEISDASERSLQTSVTIEPSWKLENSHVVVFVQARKSMSIVGAAQSKMNP
jgi:hypothetical protein